MTLEELGVAVAGIAKQLAAVQADVSDLRSDNHRSARRMDQRFEELEATLAKHSDALYKNTGRNSEVWPAAAPVHVYNEGIRGFGYEN